MHNLLPRMAGRQSGFTLVELIMVIVMLGALAVVAMPSFGSISIFGGASFNDQVRAALRYAQKTAVSHHRLVCATVAASNVTLSVASTFGASSCTSPLTPFNANSTGSCVGTFACSTKASVSPTATLYFQPSGSITDQSGASTSPVFSFTNAGTVTVQGDTGYVN